MPKNFWERCKAKCTFISGSPTPSGDFGIKYGTGNVDCTFVGCTEKQVSNFFKDHTELTHDTTPTVPLAFNDFDMMGEIGSNVLPW